MLNTKVKHIAAKSALRVTSLLVECETILQVECFMTLLKSTIISTCHENIPRTASEKNITITEVPQSYSAKF